MSFKESITVKQLINELKKYPETALVLAIGGGGYLSTLDISSIQYTTDPIIEMSVGIGIKCVIINP